MGRVALALAGAALLAVGLPARATAPVCGDPVVAAVTTTGATADNGCVTRSWTAGTLATTRIVDRRTGMTVATQHADFSIVVDGARIGSDAMPISSASVVPLADGARLVWELLVPGVASLTREVELYRGIAGFRSRTTIRSLAPLALSGYSLDEVAVGRARPTLHAFRAGADWRYDAGWNPVSVGDAHKGAWRRSTTAADGEPVRGPGQWLSVAGPAGRIALVAQRRNYTSTQASYDGTVASAHVDLSRDVAYLGPFEESAHVENPTAAPARHRVVVPGRPLPLEPSYLAVGRDEDDEAWQFSKLLERERGPIARPVIFNTDKVDRNRISTGAKDDVDYTRFLSLQRAAEAMGVEVFVFDDGWQARSGDWCADSRDCPEPRWDGSETSKFKPRFPDPRFEAVTNVLHADGMQLGLWFTPMEFHPSSAAFRSNPQWACAPVGHATAGASVADPNSGSNDAGIGVWNPLALGRHPDSGEAARLVDYIRGRVERAIGWGARYFKFDFLVWIDCAGAEPATIYEYHDAFVDMVDALRAAHPHVLFTIDETNDYRMFPYESVARGATWFQNGTPRMSQLLHNLWNLAPYVPGSALGQAALGNGTERNEIGVDKQMAAALGSHITFWTEIDTLPEADLGRVKRWTDFYKQHRDTLGGFTFPLLDDPAAGGWSALQPWNLDTASGWLLAYRQNAPASQRAIALRGLGALDGATPFRVTRIDPAAPTTVYPTITMTADELRVSGILATIGETAGYAIYRIERA